MRANIYTSSCICSDFTVQLRTHFSEGRVALIWLYSIASIDVFPEFATFFERNLTTQIHITSLIRNWAMKCVNNEDGLLQKLSSAAGVTKKAWATSPRIILLGLPCRVWLWSAELICAHVKSPRHEVQLGSRCLPSSWFRSKQQSPSFQDKIINSTSKDMQIVT